MLRWKRTVRFTTIIVFVAVVASCGLGFRVRSFVRAQDHQTVQTQVAVDANRIETLEQSQTRAATRMDEMSAKLDTVTDRLSNIQGMGEAFGFLMVILNLIVAFLQLRNKRPV